MRCKIGFIGIGNMNSAIINGICEGQNINLGEVGLYTLNKQVLEHYNSLGFTIFESAKQLAEMCDIVVLGVKPQDYFTVLNEIKMYDFLLVSIAAGITIESLLKYSDRVIRAMPNLPLSIKQGAIAISYSESVDKMSLQFVKDIFSGCGIVEEISEQYMDEILIVNGSTPAYVYYFIEKMIDDAVNRGIDYQVARKLISQTFIGAAMMVQNSENSLQSHIDSVCSKGGTTIEAIKTFETSDFEEILKKANQNCINRAKELGKVYK